MNLKTTLKIKQLFLIICLGIFAQSAFAAGNYDLLFKSGRVATQPNVAAFIANPDIQPSELFGNTYFRIIQFNKIPTVDERRLLADAGIKLTSYFPNYAYLAVINQQANLNVLTTTGARAVVVFDANWKIHKQLKGDLPPHALSGKNQVNLVVRYYKTLSADAVNNALVAKGFTVNSRYDYGNHIQIVADKTRINEIASLPFVNGVEPIAPPSTPDDEPARSLHRSSTINTYSPMGRHYDGTGVSAALADDGPVGPHIDYQGRIDQTNTTSNNGTHGDMTTGILMGGGNLNPRYRGMGTGAFIYIYDIGPYAHILNSPALNQNQGVLVTSTSYSQGCNDYTSDTQTGDQILNQNPTLLHVYSAGNNGGADCYGAGPTWGNITGGYKLGKNVLACGNLNYLDVLENSSSRGPAEDGRLKPDICANGINQMSTDGPNTYQVGGGTSAAAPGIAGIVTQLHQAYRDLNSGVTADAALIKSCMLNTAEDLGNVGPDFKHGWGRVNALRAVTTLEDNRYLSDSVDQGDLNNHTITVPANTKQLRVMLYWSDVEGDPLAAKALVNDLNMIVTDPAATIFQPWVLDPTPNGTALNTPAVQGVDDLNNAEQVTINDPASGTYSIDIDGFLIPQGPQKYYIVYEFINEEIAVTYPIGYEGFVPGETETIRWDAYGTSGTFQVEYSTDLGANWNNISAIVPATQRYLNWNVPAIVTGQALIRVTRNAFSGQSTEAFSIIGLPQNIDVDWACPDSIRLVWDPVLNATGYEVSQLGAMYMDSVAFSTTNSAIVTGINPNNEYWFSVKAITPDNTAGRRANAIYKAAGVLSCPIAIDASVEQLISPAASLQNCQDLSSSVISINVENPGLAAITDVPVFYSVNNGPVVSEIATGTLNPFANTVYNFTAVYDFSATGTYDVKVWTDYVADGNQYNDTIAQTVVVSQGVLVTLPYSENFESFNLCSTVTDCEQTQCPLANGWENQLNLSVDDIDWRTNEGSTPSANTGPDQDHNPGTTAGNYIYTEASACFNKEAIAISPCFDLTTATTPEMKFWYHMSGVDMGELHVDVFVNDVWQNDVMPVIAGNQGILWLEATVNLAPFAGNIINIRFRGNTGGEYQSDIAIDDINVYEVSAPPIPNFVASATSLCVGETITFDDLSQNSPNAWAWTVTPSTGVVYMNGTTAASQNPEVQFNNSGSYDIQLVASNGFGSNSYSIPAYIYVGPGAAAPLLETFQSGIFPPVNWTLENTDNAITWTDYGPVTGSAGTPTNVSYLNNFQYNAAGQEDGLITERVNLVGALSPIVTFDVAHARYNAQLEDALRIDISTDCGVTYFPTGYFKQGIDLATAPDNTNFWEPVNAAEWRNDTIDLTGYVGFDVELKFVNITGYGNSLFLDNVNFKESSIGISETTSEFNMVSVYPNPGSGQFTVHIGSTHQSQATMKVSDSKGSVIINNNLNLTSGSNNFKLDLTSFNKGIYMLEILSEKSTKTVKLVVM